MSTIGHRLFYSSREVGRKRVRSAAGVASLVVAVFFCASGMDLGAGGGGELSAPGGAFVARAGGARPGRAEAQRSSPDEYVTVRFTSDAPETVIDLQKIGTTVPGQDAGTPGPVQKIVTGKAGEVFSIDLPPGKYRAEGRKTGYDLVTITFNVFARQPVNPVKFTMKLTSPTPAPTPAPTPTPTPTPAPAQTPQPETTALKRFLDTKQSDLVTQEDWKQFVAITYQKLSGAPDNKELKTELYFAQGQIDFISGDFAKARNAFEAALLLDPNFAPARYGLGKVYIEKKEYRLAVEACGGADAVSYQFWLYHKCQAEAFGKLKEKEKAAAARAHAARLGYQPMGANLNAARILVERERYEESLPELLVLKDKEPSAEVYTLLGDTYLGLKQKFNARDAYIEATKYKTAEAAKAHVRLSELYLREKDTEKGLYHMREALALDSEGKFIEPEKRKKMEDELKKIEAEAQKQLNKLKDGLKKPSIP